MTVSTKEKLDPLNKPIANSTLLPKVIPCDVTALLLFQSIVKLFALDVLSIITYCPAIKFVIATLNVWLPLATVTLW